MLNIVGNAPVVAFTALDGTHVGTNVYTGSLADFQQGNALTYTLNDTEGTSQLYLNGTPLVVEIRQTPSTLIDNATQAAWPTGNQVLIASSAGYEAIATESPDGAFCQFDVNGVHTTVGACPDTMKVVEAAGAVYVGWSDGQGVTVEESKDGGTTWQVSYQNGGMAGVLGADFALRSDGGLLVVWTQYVVAEDGSSVWESDSNGLPIRLSTIVKEGFSGAGNPAVVGDGSVAWLDDSNGSASGHFDVFLDGADLSNTDDSIDEGPRLALLASGDRAVVWDDEVTIWMEEVPQ